MVSYIDLIWWPYHLKSYLAENKYTVFFCGLIKRLMSIALFFLIRGEYNFLNYWKKEILNIVQVKQKYLEATRFLIILEIPHYYYFCQYPPKFYWVVALNSLEKIPFR